MASLAQSKRQLMRLEFEDGFTCEGISFGAEKSVSGELVFQTGMVGYPESLTDPSYRGQILVCTFPLQGNYGVPSRKERDAILSELPAYFEAAEIHIAGLVVASYGGEHNYSHWLAESSLGTWLKENDVPAIHAVDTRMLTKRIRDRGSMLGKLLLQKSGDISGEVDDDASPTSLVNGDLENHRKNQFEDIPFWNPNERNLVADGEDVLISHVVLYSLTMYSSIDQTTQGLLSTEGCCVKASVRSWYPCRLCRCWSQVQSIEMSRKTWCRSRSCSLGL